MSEGVTIETRDGEIAGIVVRQHGERGFRFHSSIKGYDALDGHVFVSPAAAQKAASDFGAHWLKRSPRGSSLRGALAERKGEQDFWAYIPGWL